MLTDELIPGIVRPDTPAAAAADEVAITYCTPAIVNHCLRSYVWAAWYATNSGIAFDPELLYVASMLHDIGVVPEFDSHTVPFEDAGGHVAWVFAAGAGWPVARRRRAAEIVVRHMRGAELSEDAEGYLLAIATGLDISGRDPEWWPESFRRDVVRALPRLSLREEFVQCFEDQAKRKECRGRRQRNRRAPRHECPRHRWCPERGLAVHAGGEIRRSAITSAPVHHDDAAWSPEG